MSESETIESLEAKLALHTHLNEIYSTMIKLLLEGKPAGTYGKTRQKATAIIRGAYSGEKKDTEHDG